MYQKALFKAFLSLVIIALAGCASRTPAPPPSLEQKAIRVVQDFSGSWERNYARGSDINQELVRIYRRLASAQGSSVDGSGRRSIGSSSGMEPVIALARLADAITQYDVLQIDQSKNHINIEREDEFALYCEYYDQLAEQLETAFGNELCGWDGDQFVYHLSLPDGLTIIHRFSISPQKNELHVATTLKSNSSRYPFTLNRFYQKFEPIESDYSCIQTFSRKKVCTKIQED